MCAIFYTQLVCVSNSADIGIADYGGSEPQAPGAAPVFQVTQSRTTVTMLWPDGRRTQHSATELEPCGNMDDEHDVWPGDIAVWVGGDESRVAVVQSMEPRQRTAEVLWYDASVRWQPMLILFAMQPDVCCLLK